MPQDQYREVASVFVPSEEQRNALIGKRHTVQLPGTDRYFDIPIEYNLVPGGYTNYTEKVPTPYGGYYSPFHSWNGENVTAPWYDRKAYTGGSLPGLPDSIDGVGDPSDNSDSPRVRRPSDAVSIDMPPLEHGDVEMKEAPVTPSRSRLVRYSGPLPPDDPPPGGGRAGGPIIRRGRVWVAYLLENKQWRKPVSTTVLASVGAYLVHQYNLGISAVQLYSIVQKSNNVWELVFWLSVTPWGNPMGLKDMQRDFKATIDGAQLKRHQSAPPLTNRPAPRSKYSHSLALVNSARGVKRERAWPNKRGANFYHRVGPGPLFAQGSYRNRLLVRSVPRRESVDADGHYFKNASQRYKKKRRARS